MSRTPCTYTRVGESTLEGGGLRGVQCFSMCATVNAAAGAKFRRVFCYVFTLVKGRQGSGQVEASNMSVLQWIETQGPKLQGACIIFSLFFKGQVRVGTHTSFVLYVHSSSRQRQDA